MRRRIWSRITKDRQWINVWDDRGNSHRIPVMHPNASEADLHQKAVAEFCREFGIMAHTGWSRATVTDRTPRLDEYEFEAKKKERNDR